jgi:16S rRNA (guanine966-N2)-methyltransferase
MQNKQGKRPVYKTAVRSAPQQVRIIGGQWKRTPLPVISGEGLRPTPDRVRETVFNWLNHLFDGAWPGLACLDLFAGTGALGFEAASRGAARILMVDANTPAVRQLEAVKDKLGAAQVTILRADAQSAVQGLVRTAAGERFDVIFLDPPYEQGWLPKMLPACVGLLAPHGVVYAEAEYALTSDTAPDWLAGWDVVRADKAGLVFYHLLQRKGES